MQTIDFKKELNDEQYEVVSTGNGPHLVLAGAGSGKTRTLVYRVAWLIQNGVNPNKILLITFTNKAANEMMERVRAIMGSDKNIGIWGGTFHSIAHRLLRMYGENVGIPKDFVILDESDAKSLIKNISKDYFKNLNEKRKPSASLLKEVLSYSLNSSRGVEETMKIKFPEWQPHSGDFISVFNEYKKRKTISKFLDFDDLLCYLKNLTLDNSSVNKISDRWEHILVDEYQDTNHIQAEIVCNLSKKHQNIIAVGDDAQSIYSFRGANINNILDFPKIFKNSVVHKLETNYRSSPEIVSLANKVISGNNSQFTKNLRAVLASNLKPELIALRTNKEEARYIVDKIERFLMEGYKSSEIAVLFRASNHSQQLEMELNSRGIAYEMRGGLKFFERAHVKDVIAFLRIYKNLKDEISLYRVLEMYEGIGAATISKIYKEILGIEKLEELFSLQISLGEKAKNGWAAFLRALKAISKVEEKGLMKMIEVLVEDYSSYLISQYPDYKQRQEDLDQLALFANNYTNLEEFLSEISLQENFGLKNKRQSGGDSIVLSTVHQAKGLEWKAVFIMNLIDEAFPHTFATTVEEIEEERRLFYVAITRAKKHLILTYPLAVFKYDGFKSSEPSEFITCIDKALLDYNQLARSSVYTASNSLDDMSYESDGDDLDSSGPREYLPSIGNY